MNPYRILNTRKRAMIALVHSIAFGLLASYQFVSNQHPIGLANAHSPHLSGPIALTAIYFIVTTVLLVLFRLSGCGTERLYFGLCTGSAAVGLWRVAFGDPTAHLGGWIRVLLLGAAVIVCMLILRSHSVVPEFAD